MVHVSRLRLQLSLFAPSSGKRRTVLYRFGLGFLLIVAALAILTLKKAPKVDDTDDDLTDYDELDSYDPN